ncbi:MAG: SMC-Scp complex subunit ScpB, partial [Clostridia bacterium]|nr:SMC-Scp complex subunit ScpB [Clostridia bacterium]
MTLDENLVSEPSVLSDDEKMSIIEAVLFAAGYPVGYAKLAAVTGGTPAEIKKLVNERADYYNSPDSLPRGIMLLCFSDSCQLCTKSELGGYIRDALGIKRGGNLSASSLEVLAIVAYNEPVTRSFIDTVRGVDSSYAVNSLTEKHLIEPCGRLDVPGRPMLYRTTEDFLRVFGMSSLGDLPAVDGHPDVEKDDATIPMEGMEFTESTDYSGEDGTTTEDVADKSDES